jgi:hypothetical protein
MTRNRFKGINNALDRVPMNHHKRAWNFVAAFIFLLFTGSSASAQALGVKSGKCG